MFKRNRVCESVLAGRLLLAAGIGPLLAATPLVCAQQRVADPRAVALDRLSRPISVSLENERLEDVIKFLATVSNTTIDPLWLDDRGSTGLDRDARVSVRAHEVPVLTVLERALQRVQDSFDGNSWSMTEDGIIEVGPKSRLNRRTELKIYDIQDLLFQIPNYADAPEIDIDQATQQTGGGGGGTGSIFDQDDQDDREQRRSTEDQALELIDIIIETIEPEQWRDNGGDAATIRFYRGTLIVRAPDYIHRQLGGYDFWPRGLSRRYSDRQRQYDRSENRPSRTRYSGSGDAGQGGSSP